MREQAQSSGLSERTLAGGLIVTLRRRGESLYLSLGRTGGGPGAGERERWTRAFRVPGESFGYRYLLGEYRFVQYEWKEVKNGND